MKKLLALTLIFMVFFSGCYTKKTYKESTYEEFDEKIVAFAMKEDNKSFIILGEKYSYVFESNEILGHLIENLNEAYTFNMEKGVYEINQDGKAYAWFSVYIDENKSSKRFIDWALKNGAYRVSDDNSLRLSFTKIKGKFYLPNEKLNKSVPKLDREFKIKVNKEKIVDKEKTELSTLSTLGAGLIILPALFFVVLINGHE
ncbi:hypothetical protein A7H1H_0763 [Aliarcobacter butzleri 7h1h]|uniref:hypothetical protein n=1 Tax=Aliarcobacter butzleri TaxID=28197 RepID=UPI0002F89C85|nr:hypothetical protein [Aliarcobacter butzleri]AGR77074.1 hypothetical protein A7H1H_0763 [Aliarcobacter butzleri 7h1h]MBF7070786.1 hypothetical protein [Aliarcobacter butzleri]MCG3697427.1 hypothetical protein [Aliarcobacter butzleri]MDN5072621.1 hypothetical protein [Aliarcobacter butzleri]MDN5121599.1 hypothetical protein [Aliarcobacter butzleri]